ncbi:hypothetical protein CR152_07240 [Massilia violaceinigra]|uniref:Uncharacterized protein n=1 Tax=Massilia violaceinigra TaxID=2045208 RepID=A0A2D2DHA8_9BURK|nr:hypothetical protein [Massilia violaceinigra]ATQ74325.1 hypothetical protein CR152_07240 [Massilia violaceinigra]
MTVNLDVLSATASPAGARLDRRDAEARQDRWMQQLERAAFDAVAKPDNPRVQRAAAPGAPAAASPPQAQVQAQAVKQAEAANAQPAAHEAASGVAARGPASEAPADACGQPRASAASPAARAAGTRASGAAPDAVQAAQPGQPDTDAVPHSPVHAMLAASAPATPEEVNPAPAAVATPAAFVAQAYALAGAGAVARSGTMAPGSPAAMAVTAASAAPAAAPAFGFGPFGAQPEAAPAAPQEQAEAGHGAPERHAAGEPEQYAKTLMHVYRDNDGVHAWLRDAALSQNQVRAVAQAMAGEFARSGTPLAALTVNGRKIVAGPGLADDAEETRAAADGAHDDILLARRVGMPAVQGAV